MTYLIPCSEIKKTFGLEENKVNREKMIPGGGAK